MLFHGNPYLIEGFNTFLPPGYYINTSTDPRDPNLITVTTPLGTMTSRFGAGMGGSSGNKTQVERAPATELDHAILFVKKIKTRYPDYQNNTYEQFLDIIRTCTKKQQNFLKDSIGYQHWEQKMMHDVRILSYQPLLLFVRPRKRRSLFHTFISRCKRF